MPRERVSTRWRGYDYASVGPYYLTICTHHRAHLFGRIVEGVMHPSPIGVWAQHCWEAIREHLPHARVDEFVVMPNHIHGIVVIQERIHRVGARQDAPPHDPRKPPGIPPGALGQIVASYRSAVTRMAYRDGSVPHGTPVWQRNYWDRVIRDYDEYERIARYIRDNPVKWNGDRFNG